MKTDGGPDCQLGVGVLIQLLGREPDPKEDALAEVKGKKIRSILLDDDANDGDGALVFTFDTGAVLTVFDRGRSCCESRYMKCDDDLEKFFGSTLDEITIECGDTMEGESDYCHEVEFLLVHTSRGIFTVNTHNEHNGYYGGFWMVSNVTHP